LLCVVDLAEGGEGMRIS